MCVHVILHTTAKLELYINIIIIIDTKQAKYFQFSIFKCMSTLWGIHVLDKFLLGIEKQQLLYYLIITQLTT